MTPTRTRHRRLAVALAALCTAIAALGCSESDRTETPGVAATPPAGGAAEPSPRPNFVVIVADTLRADRIDGDERRAGITPHLDALRGRGTYFANALSTSSWTLPATVSIFTSQLPSRHGAWRWTSRIDDGLQLVSELFQRAGWRTGGWSANRLIERQRGFRRGFDEFELLFHPDWKPGMPPDSPYAFALAPDLNERALEWLDRSAQTRPDAPFFLYLHLMEPHTPLLCPPDVGPECGKATRQLNRNLLNSVWLMTAESRELIEKFYDSDVRSLDAAIGALVDALSERGLLENTWIVFTADHGEMLSEHGLYLHGRALYEETVHVPLLIVPPAGRGRRVDAPVSLIDIAPTLLDIAGIETPPEFDGHSLLTALAGVAPEPRVLVSELRRVTEEGDKRQRHWVAVRKGDEKVLLSIDGTVQRVDLRTDPGEALPRDATRTELEALLAEAGVPLDHDLEGTDDAHELTPEMREHLKGLGYLQE